MPPSPPPKSEGKATMRPAPGKASMAPRPAPGPGMQRPLSDPGASLGGLDLSGLAAQGHAESQTRVAGQGSLMDGYMASVLGEAKGRAGADSEREERLMAFRRQQALMEEERERQRLGNAATGQRERIAAAASEAQTQRQFQAEQANDARIFELGQVAATDGNSLDDQRLALDQQRYELEKRQVDAALGDGTQNFGQDELAFGRGQYLAGRPIADDIRSRSFGPDPQAQIADLPDWARGEAREQLAAGGNEAFNRPTFEDQKAAAREIALKLGPVAPLEKQDPAKFQRQILELFNGSATAASLALSDLGEIADWNAGL